MSESSVEMKVFTATTVITATGLNGNYFREAQDNFLKDLFSTPRLSSLLLRDLR